MDSFPDDEMCDLETLEALLNEEDDDEDKSTSKLMSVSRKGDVKCQNNKSMGLSREQEEFMNAESDDSDEEMVEALERHKGSDTSISPMSKKPNETYSASLHESSSSGSVKKGNRKSSDDESFSSTADDQTYPSSTLTLMKEMEEMKKKMEEMQKMLQSQQHVEKKEIVKEQVSSRTVIPAAETKPTKMRLMAEDEEDGLFFKRHSTSSKASPSVKHSPSVLPKKKKTNGSVESTVGKSTLHDSDSDWEDLDGGGKSSLSEEGKNIQRLLKLGEKRKESDRSKFDPDFSSSQASHKNLDMNIKKEMDNMCDKKNTGDNKRSLQCSSSSTDQSKSGRPKEEDPEKFVVEDFSRIRIVNPLISSSVMRMRMDGRKLITLSRIHVKLNTPELQSDWVTIGVVVSKTNAKASNSGKPYSIWKLSDLHDLEHCASFFLFGQVHKNHWKLDVGTVVGLLNPSMMEAMEKNKTEPAFTLKNPNQLMVMGRSKDLGWCIGLTKKGNKCSHFVNKRQGDYCSYHVQAAYKKTSAQRLEFHGSVTGVTPRSFEQKIFAKNCAYMYGGNTFVPNSASTKSKKGLTLSKLQEKVKSSRKVSTFSIQDIKPSLESAAKERKITEDKNDVFMDMVAVPTAGAMNLVAHLKKNDKASAVSSPSSSRSRQSIESVSAGDLLKQHRQAMRMRQPPKPKASELLLASKDEGPLTPNTSSDPLKRMPVLGKGLSAGQDVSLAVSGKSDWSSVADRSKLKAIQALKSNGGISKEDPNAVRKAKGEKELQAIRKRAHKEPKSSESEESSDNLPSASTNEPKSKRSKFLGNVDLNSAEVKAILKAKSKHVGALAEKEAEREEAYFDNLEKKEVLEEKMKSVTSIEINVFTCKQCHYTAQSASEQCKKEQHSIVKSKSKKRFFACKKCKHRTTTINGMFPSSPCQKCGSLGFEKTSMYKEKAGPKLDSEILSLRGDEVKFLNSLDHKVFMNTVVD